MAKQHAPKTNVACPPDEALFRQSSPQNSTLNKLEADYIKLRSEKTLEAWKDWITGEDVGYNMTLFKDKFPKVGMGLSGGGLRAATLSAAVINALDSRNDAAKKLGTGGLYDVTSYLTGISGGSWSLGGIVMGNASATLPELVNDWMLDKDLLSPKSSSGDPLGFVSNVLSGIVAKHDAGFTTTLIDFWAGAIAHHFLPGTNSDNFFDNSSHGAGQLWSGIANQPQFKSATIPFPIAASCSRSGQENAVTANDIVYEMTPFEFGSFDPGLLAWVNMSHAGTVLNGGKPANPSACVTGFDQASFIMGTSSAFFDSQPIIQPLLDTLDVLLPELKKLDNGDLEARWPNPFEGFNAGNFMSSGSESLMLDDGGENHANIPVEQLVVKARQVDVTVLVDSSDDTTDSFPNGTSLIFASRRLQNQLSVNHQQLPPIPSDFTATGNNLHVSFFGCDPKQTPPEFPLVIYIPNSPPCNGDNPVTNAPTVQMSFTPLHQEDFLSQGFSVATCGFVPNATGPDTNFPNCLKCAVIDRARLTADPVIPRSSECQTCFDRYCFDPNNPPSAKDIVGRKFTFVDPNPKSFAQRHIVLIAVLSSVLGSLLIFACCMITCCYIRRRRRRRRKSTE